MPLEPWQWKHTNHPGILRKSASCLTILGVVTLGKLWGSKRYFTLILNVNFIPMIDGIVIDVIHY